MMRATRATLPPVSSTTIEGLYATGYWLFMQRRVAHALSVFRAMIHLSPYDERGWLALGTCYEAQDQADVALHVYESSFRMLVAAPLCHLARARILRAQGRSKEAQRALVEAARAAQSSPDTALRELIAAEWQAP
jgi:tetratricopeptide (TPR) repeat protein